MCVPGPKKPLGPTPLCACAAPVARNSAAIPDRSSFFILPSGQDVRVRFGCISLARTEMMEIAASSDSLRQKLHLHHHHSVLCICCLRTAPWAVQRTEHVPMLPSAAQQFQLEVASSLVSPRVDSHVCVPKDGPGYHLSIRGWGHHYRGCPGPKNANAYGSRRRMTPLSRSDPVLRFVRSRQGFVRRCHGTEKAPTIKGRGKVAKKS